MPNNECYFTKISHICIKDHHDEKVFASCCCITCSSSILC